jgi:hypothetical protein
MLPLLLVFLTILVGDGTDIGVGGVTMVSFLGTRRFDMRLSSIREVQAIWELAEL